MKKIYFLFIVAVFFVSCQGPIGPEGPAGIGTNWQIINLTVASGDWVVKHDNDGNIYYAAHFPMPEITSFVYTDGTVIGYIDLNGVQMTLPYVTHFKNAANQSWTRTVDYDYSVGGMNVYVTNSDFAADPPAAMNFRIVLMW
ncbi:MAG: hypothetical protein ACYC25_02170 [Paludibacter sp.]